MIYLAPVFGMESEKQAIPGRGARGAAHQQGGLKQGGGIGFVPPSPVFSTHSAVTQRLATDSIEQPEEQGMIEDKEKRSDLVPDLPVKLVTAIQKAVTAEQRRDVLQVLFSYLKAKGVVDEPNLTVVTYSGWAFNNNQALTGYVLKKNQKKIEDDTPITITFYPSAFAAGPAELYSTLRHELIHAAQRMKVPDDPTDITDNYIQEDIYTETGQQTLQSLQIPMQEIETHAWELDHSGETGIGKEYIKTTQKMLEHYTQEVITAVKSEKILSNQAYSFWSGYIYRSLLTLKNCQDRTMEINEAIEDLEEAIENREQLVQNENAEKEDLMNE